MYTKQDIDFAWLVGLFEGEGCMSVQSQGRAFTRLSMVDEDAVRRAHTIAGVGTVKRSPTPTVSGKWMWNWGVGRCDDAVALIDKMLPMFCERRAARAREVLESTRNAPVPKRLRTHCKRGHELNGDNLKVDMSGGTPRRTCRACSVINTRNYNERHPEKVQAYQEILNTRRRMPPRAPRTHCPYGHPLSGDNLGIGMNRGKPRKYCRACNIVTSHEHYLRRQAARAGVEED